MILLVKGRPLGSERVKKLSQSLNPFTPKSDLIDFTLSNARRFYSPTHSVILDNMALYQNEIGVMYVD